MSDDAGAMLVFLCRAFLKIIRYFILQCPCCAIRHTYMSLTCTRIETTAHLTFSTVVVAAKKNTSRKSAHD